MIECDVIVLGGGPAGATCAAECALGGARVVLVERTAHVGWRVGEVVSRRAAAALASAGFARALDRAVPIASARVGWGDTPLPSAPPSNRETAEPAAWIVDRARFDRALLAVARHQGVDVWSETRVTRYARDKRAWQVDILGPRGPARVSGKVVVDATGRAAWFARRQGARLIDDDRLVAVVARALENGLDGLVVEAVPCGWIYAVPVGGTQAVVAWLTDSDLLPRERSSRARGLRDAIADTSLIRCSVEIVGERMQIRAAASSMLAPASGEGWIAVGDAACTVDPLCGEGIARAVISGGTGARAVLAALARGGVHIIEHEFEERRTADFAAFRIERVNVYARAARWDTAFWRRRRRPPLSLVPLTPEAIVQVDSPTARMRDRLEALLGANGTDALVALVRTGGRASDLVVELRARCASVDDWTGILALQQLAGDLG